MVASRSLFSFFVLLAVLLGSVVYVALSTDASAAAANPILGEFSRRRTTSSATKKRIESAEIHHYEPILDYSLHHSDNKHLYESIASKHSPHVLSTTPSVIHEEMKAYHAPTVRAFAADSTYATARTFNGLHQPYPQKLHMKFNAFGQTFDLSELTLMAHLFEKDSKTTIYAHGELVQEIPHTLSSYHQVLPKGGWATVTLREDGLFHAVIATPQGTFQAEPLEAHKHIMSAENMQALSEVAVHNMVIFQHDDVKDWEEKYKCGGAHVPTDNWRAQQREEVQSTSSAEGTSSASTQPLDIHVHSRKSSRELLAVALWTNCYPGDSTKHQISVGAIADYGYYKIYGATNKVQAAIAAIYAAANSIYVTQMNVFLKVSETMVMTTTGGQAWNREPTTSDGRCTVTIDTDLNDLTAWRKASKPKTYSLWHLHTNCFPAPGTVGLAWVGVICASSYGTGVSSWSSTDWLTTAHEIGHNFGAQHTFQNGQGKTGGIMDYGDGKYPPGTGEYQFNSQYNQAEVCKELSDTVSFSPSSGILPFCWSDYAPTCGNGIVESGEDCDDTTSCCVNCRYASGAVCSPGANNMNECCSASCQFFPTTTQCGSNNVAPLTGKTGFCGNGKCISSDCNVYSNLAYCGTVANNPCRQTCFYNGGSCTDSFSSPDLNMDNGLVCNTATYSVCSSGKCTATTNPGSTLTYSWKKFNPSACSCAGTMTYTVQCQDQNGNVASDSSCTATKPTTQDTCTAPSTCSSTWVTAAWSTCTNTCGTGTQTRAVTCQANGAVVADSFCTTTKPATFQTCNTAPCPVAWSIGVFGSCTVSCGTGVQSRTVTCKQTQNGIDSTVSDSFCPQPKPATTQSCNTQACTDGQWSYTAYSACTVTCGGGVQTRSAICTVNNVQVDPARCSGSQPTATSQPCNTGNCPNYVWFASPTWSTCSASCGGGTQTRSVVCRDDANGGVTMPNNYCTGSMPLSLQSCNSNICPTPPNYNWFTGDYGACSVSCGGGVTTRSVWCTDLNNSTRPAFPDSFCSSVANNKPATSSTCNVQACPSYSWITSAWSICNKPCNNGTQTRTISCVDQSGTAVASTNCKGTAPATTQVCNTNACPTATNGAWVVTNWSNCTRSCGTGVQTATIRCIDINNNNILSDSACANQTRPASAQSCNTGACPTFWYTSTWSTCNQDCGSTGTQTRTVQCLLTTDVPGSSSAQPDSACTAPKPSTIAACNVFPCPRWVASNTWGPCSARCGQGTQTRNTSCVSYDGRVVSSSICLNNNSPQPVVRQVCQTIPCPHWHRYEWGTCSQSCGGGIQNRTLICRMPHDQIYFGEEQPDTTLCPTDQGDTSDGAGDSGIQSGKPSSWQYCNTQPCPTFYWQLGTWSACSKACTGADGVSGTTTTTAVCMSSLNRTRVSESLCGTQPAISQVCNTDPCPVYAWRTGNWSTCRGICGNSVQTRLVECYNVRPAANMHLDAILVDDSLCATAGARPAAWQNCTVANTDLICSGAQYATTLDNTQRTGRCDVSRNMCVCRAGYVGWNCSTLGAITAVSTNSAQFTAGVPLGEQLVVSWTSTLPANETVSIALVALSNLAQWPTPQFIGTGLLNSGKWSWKVGGSISDLENLAFKVRVYYSPLVYADSAPLTIADPCGYVSCGTRGKCVRGACVCDAGFSGAACTTGPCELAQCDSVNAVRCSNDVLLSSAGWLNGSVSVANNNVCQCLNGYSGPRCKTPPNCLSALPRCLNGGDYENIPYAGGNSACGAASNSTSCKCTNLWTGSTCGSCGLQCANGGVANGVCTSCNCGANSGWFGPTCGCKYLLLTFRLNVTSATTYTSLLNDPIAQLRYSRTIASDLVNAIATTTTQPVRVAVTSFAAAGTTSQAVLVTFRLALPCPGVSERVADAPAAATERLDDWVAPAASAPAPASASTPVSVSPQRNIWRAMRAEAAAAAVSASSPVPVFTRLDATTPPGNLTSDQLLLYVYTALLPLLSNTNSPVWGGVASSAFDSSYTPVATDPTGQPLSQPSTPQDCIAVDCSAANSGNNDSGNNSPSSSSSGDGKTIGIAVGVALGVALLLLVAYCCLRSSKNSQKANAVLPPSSPYHINQTTQSQGLQMNPLHTNTTQ